MTHDKKNVPSVSVLAPMDRQGLLAGAVAAASEASGELDVDELLAELEGAMGSADITELRHVRSSVEKQAAEEIAIRITAGYSKPS